MPLTIHPVPDVVSLLTVDEVLYPLEPDGPHADGDTFTLTLTAEERIAVAELREFLKALVAFELKVGAFEPEHAGKMDFYLNLLNDKERGPDDQPSIGIILCAEKDDVEVEYALRSKANPIGVAAYELKSKLPGELKGKLPTAKQLADVVRVELDGGR